MIEPTQDRIHFASGIPRRISTRLGSALAFLPFIALSSTGIGCSSVNSLKPEAAKRAFPLPSPETQREMILAIRDEMIRLDGEGLIPRKNRPESFRKTTDRIAKDALRNETPFDFYRTFSRLDATYPNLHANVGFSPGFDPEIVGSGNRNMEEARINLSVEAFTPTKTRTVIRFVAAGDARAGKWDGSELTAINGIPLGRWQDENFLFCKWARRSVCDRNIEESILKGILFWKGGPLIYAVKNEHGKANFTVEFEKPESKPGSPPTDPFARRRCDWKWKERYPGFELIHPGYFACLFRKKDDASVLLLRISSFQYRRGRKIDPKSPIQTMKQETDALKEVWIPRSASAKHLILDLIDNGGGDEPMDYYRMLFRKPFLEQYVEFKKIPEIEEDRLRTSMFWEDNGHELWFRRQKALGAWDHLKKGGFSDPSPMFCADDAHPCGETEFQPFEHRFTGRITVMLNDGCVSTCDGVAWMLATRLGAKLYGFYPAADSAYSRLRIDAIRDPESRRGFKLEVSPQRADPPADLLISQDVAVTRTVDKNGKALAGRPPPLARFVPIRWDRDYHRDVLNAVIGASPGH